jgi:hypothetical protein
MMIKFIKDHKRLQVALAGYSVVSIFILSYLLANQIQDWLGRSAQQQLIALVFAILITAPLALVFVWERLRGVKIFNVELNFAGVTIPLSITLPNEIQQVLELGGTGPSDILDKIKTAIRQEQTKELVEVNLRDGKF